MRSIHVIGIGVGDPDHVTTQAIRALDADAALRDHYIALGHSQAARYSPEIYRENLKAVYDRHL